MAEALIPAAAVSMRCFCKSPTTYNQKSRHQIQERGVLAETGKDESYPDYKCKDKKYFTRVCLA